jgi:hypothetical protein
MKLGDDGEFSGPFKDLMKVIRTRSLLTMAGPYNRGRVMNVTVASNGQGDFYRVGDAVMFNYSPKVIAEIQYDEGGMSYSSGYTVRFAGEDGWHNICQVSKRANPLRNPEYDGPDGVFAGYGEYD